MSTNDQERKRIMEMVETGKISSQEAADLLDAMGKSNAMRGQEKFSLLDMTFLLGVILVLLGFFMPWQHKGMRMKRLFFSTFSGISKSGSELGAIGWVIFTVAVLSAISVFITPKELLYKASMLQIFLVSLGIALVGCVLFRINGWIGAGLWVCLLGFTASLTAGIIKFKKLTA